jgi:hypothetical protein
MTVNFLSIIKELRDADIFAGLAIEVPLKMILRPARSGDAFRPGALHG